MLIGSEVREMVSDGGVAILLSAAYPWLYGLSDAVIGAYSDVMRVIWCPGAAYVQASSHCLAMISLKRNIAV